MAQKFSLKRHIKKHDGYVILYKDMDGIKIQIDMLTPNEVDSYRKKYHFIVGPHQGKNDSPNPRYATTKEICEKFKKRFEVEE